MLEYKFDDCEICPWQTFEKFRELQHFDTFILGH